MLKCICPNRSPPWVALPDVLNYCVNVCWVHVLAKSLHPVTDAGPYTPFTFTGGCGPKGCGSAITPIHWGHGSAATTSTGTATTCCNQEGWTRAISLACNHINTIRQSIRVWQAEKRPRWNRLSGTVQTFKYTSYSVVSKSSILDFPYIQCTSWCRYSTWCTLIGVFTTTVALCL